MPGLRHSTRKSRNIHSALLFGQQHSFRFCCVVRHKTGIEWVHRFYLSFFLFFSYWTPPVHRINILPCLSWCIKHLIPLTLHHYGKLSISNRVYRDAFHLRFDICELNIQRHVTTRLENATAITPAVMITTVVILSPPSDVRYIVILKIPRDVFRPPCPR